ncbi:uncharacterized protein TNCV_2623841 [Trichonephila clavipes]|nr:uncharacterized protein TNCV_2623841 [Trichonephila clavipes]
MPSLDGGTLNSHQTANPLVSLVEGEEMREALDNPQGVLPQNWGGTEPNRTITCMVLKSTTNDWRKNLAPCSDEFRGPCSDQQKLLSRDWMLRQCTLLVWYESTMSHKKAIEALNRTLHDLRHSTDIMGRMVALLAGVIFDKLSQ